MTRKRVTASAKKQRHEWAIRQIDAGVGLSELTALTAETWGVSRRTARDVTAKAHKDWIEAFNHQDINQRDLLFQCLGRLERTARKAEESGNFACVIGAVAQMNKMMKLGADQQGRVTSWGQGDRR
jgi:hypothetical protein